MVNTLNIVGREEDMVGLGADAVPPLGSLLCDSAVVTRVVYFN